MNKPVIAIDCDITLWDTDCGWFDYLDDRTEEQYYGYTHCKDSLNKRVNYNLTSYFSDITFEEGMKYWDKPETYVNCKTHKHAVETIRQLYMAGCEIVFVTYCMGSSVHANAKYKRLLEDFDFIPKDELNFVATNNKGLVKADIIVDDRNKYLNQMSEGVKLIKFDSPYTQEETIDREYVLCEDWYQVEDELVKFLEEFDYSE